MPYFYPVYQYEDYYSHSVLALVLLKSELRLNQRVADMASRPDFLYTSTPETIDLEIMRLGGPVVASNVIRDEDVYVAGMASALIEDCRETEARHEGSTNVILCGGKDSLNLLLLPWANSTVVASAPPNYELVVRFIQENGLDFETISLNSADDATVQEHEVLENACRLNLEHARWGADLCRIARRYPGGVLFWKGQLADLYTTRKWMTLTEPLTGFSAFWRKVYKRFEPIIPERIGEPIAEKILQPCFRRAIWDRSDMWQGAHMSLIRSLTDSLVLSAYHGPRMRELFTQVDLFHCVKKDIRDHVGETLLGHPVKYPTDNPSPKPSSFMRGLAAPSRFQDLLRKHGVRITAQ
jgi:hypothetical protein